MDAGQEEEIEKRLYNLYRTAQYVDSDMEARLKKALKEYCDLADNSSRELNYELISIDILGMFILKFVIIGSFKKLGLKAFRWT